MWDLKIKSADNRILQEQLQIKVTFPVALHLLWLLVLRYIKLLTVISNFFQMSENAEMQESILLLRQQLSSVIDKSSSHQKQMADNEVDMLRNFAAEASRENSGWVVGHGFSEVTYVEGKILSNVKSVPDTIALEDYKGCNSDISVNTQVLMQVISFCP